MAMFRIEFEAHGTGTFPADMLRYDGCHPRTDHAVGRIMLSRSNCDDSSDMVETRIVRLGLHVATTRKHINEMVEEGQIPTVRRWASFGWAIYAVRIIEVQNMY